ncbi:MAG: sterol desaturase family protein [Caulobacteraceae bacterium]
MLIRALFPRWLLLSPSMRADLGFFLLNSFVTGSLIGWGLFSYAAITHGATDAMVRVFGAGPHPAMPPPVGAGLMTVALFLAYDFSYWVDHALKHKVPALWEFHRVHHTAEVLSPLTAFRMHPVDSLVFANITAAAMGAVNGVGLYLLGGTAKPATLSGTNVILVVFVFAVIHLQHSHIPIRIGGWLGRVVFSPAHHHIHHSTRVEHYGCNLGSCLAVWDWMFGTLILPDEVKGRLTFGGGHRGRPLSSAFHRGRPGPALHPRGADARAEVAAGCDAGAGRREPKSPLTTSRDTAR